MLKEFVRSLSSVIRQQVDWAGRYGGEAFLVVLPETDQAGAMVVAERLRETIQQCETQIEKCTLPITASFGVTGFSPRDWKESVKPEALLQQADILLYEAKEAGREQVKGRLLPVP